MHWQLLQIAYAALLSGFLRTLPASPKGPPFDESPSRWHSAYRAADASGTKGEHFKDVAFCALWRQYNAWTAEDDSPERLSHTHARAPLDVANVMHRGVKKKKKLYRLCKASGGWFKVVNKVHLPIKPVQRLDISSLCMYITTYAADVQPAPDRTHLWWRYNNSSLMSKM